jgi:pimeloyl-ACP methyl ester carboxylesterase
MAVCLPPGKNILNPRLATTPPAELGDWLLSRNPAGEAARAEAPKTDRRAIQTSMENLENLDISNLTRNMKTPCLQVYGFDDPLLELKEVDAHGAGGSHIHRIVFEESGHFPMLEEATKFNRLLVDFLALESGESPQQLQLKEEWKRRVR